MPQPCSACRLPATAPIHTQPLFSRRNPGEVMVYSVMSQAKKRKEMR
jgi:hypothetical protein